MNLRKIINNDGFTLTETLIVLSMFLIICIITAIQLTPYFRTINSQYFLTQLADDLYYAQMYAITNQKKIYVNFLPDQYKYYFREDQGKVIFEREYDESIWLYEGSVNLHFEFSANGNINKFGTFSIRIDGVRYRIVFQLGRGRFYFDGG